MTADTTETNAAAQPTAEQKHKHLIFINEMAAHGRQRHAYMAAYPGCTPQTADRGAHRLMEKPGVRAGIEYAREKMAIAQQRMHEDQLARQLCKLEDKEEVVWQILKGELQHTVYGKNGEILKRVEDPGLRLRAMKQDTALAKERAMLMHEIAQHPGLALALYNATLATPNPTEQPGIELPSFDDAYGADPGTYQGDQGDSEDLRFDDVQTPATDAGKCNTPEDDPFENDFDGNNAFPAPPAGLYESLSPEERREIDEIRQRIIAAQEQTKKVLYSQP